MSKSFKTLQGPQKPIYRLAQWFFNDNLRTTKGMSTGKTFQKGFVRSFRLI